MNSEQVFTEKGVTHFKLKILPPELIINNYLEKDKRSCPEEYLCELLNHSVYFKSKTKGNPFIRPEIQSHGENDAVSIEYEIDFKILVSSSMMQALHLSVPGKVMDSNGVLFEATPRGKREMYAGTLLQPFF